MSIDEWARSGTWRQLEALAHRMVAYAESKAGGALMSPRLGGGTRLMLDLRHRISDDVDLFISDAQWLSYLSPRLNDQFETHIQSYDETGEALKLDCAGGQIDFIVRPSLLGGSPKFSPESLFEMDSCEEVLAKKLFYRGELLTSRDLYDWRAVAAKYPGVSEKIAAARLFDATRYDSLLQRLSAMATDPRALEQWWKIRPSPSYSLDAAIKWAVDIAPSIKPPSRVGSLRLRGEPKWG